MELTDKQIEDLISLGYDLHIHDQSGKYPNGLDRGEWERREKDRILLWDTLTPSSEQDKPQCSLDCKGIIQKPGEVVVGKAESHTREMPRKEVEQRLLANIWRA